MYFSQIEFATPEYDQSIRLRTDILRTPLGLEFLAKDLAEEWKEYHLAAFDDNSKLVGILVFRPLDRKKLKMRQVAISEHLQKQGIGRKLVKYSEVWARNKGFKRLELSARDTAIPFYKNMEYKTIGKEFIEVNIKHMKMVKDL